MDEAVGGLEIEFKRVVNDLEYVSHHLEKDFRSRQATSGVSDVVSLIRRISALESNLITTKKRSEKLLSHRQQVTSMSASIMLSNHARLSRLLEEFGREEHQDEARCDLLDMEADKENGPNNHRNNVITTGVNGDHTTSVDDDNDDNDPSNPDCDSGMKYTHRMKMEECREVRQELLEVLKECTFVPDPSQLMMMGGDSGGSGGGGTAGTRTTAASSSSGAVLPLTTSSSATNNNNSSTGGPYTHPTSNLTPSTATISTKPPPPPPPSSSAPPFDVITGPQFEAVSSTTRGRCKLTDCQVRRERETTT